MERLTAADSWYLQVESPTVPMHVAGVMILEPKTAGRRLTPTRLRDHIARRFATIPSLRRRLVEVPFGIDHPVWVEDPDFDLDHHLSRHILGRPGEPADLDTFVGHFLSPLLDRSKPLWQMALVEGLEGKRIAIVVKLHHCLVDGASGLAILGELIDLTAEPTARASRPSDASARAERVPGRTELVAGALWNRAVAPMRPLRAATHVASSMANLATTAAARRRSGASPSARPLDAPRTPLNGVLTTRRTTAFTQLPLDDFKRVRTAFGATVNDVVLAVCSGALRGYLDARGALPDRPLVCSVPVSTHGHDDADRSTNQVSSLFVHLPVHLADPLDRLAAVHETAEGAKQYHAALGGSILGDAVEMIPTTLLRLGSRAYGRSRLPSLLPPIQNLIVSNVIGPPNPLYIAGAEVVGLYPVGLLTEGTGLNITVFSSNGVVNFGLLACPDLVDDLPELVSGIRRSLEELLALAA